MQCRNNLHTKNNKINAFYRSPNHAWFFAKPCTENLLIICRLIIVISVCIPTGTNKTCLIKLFKGQTSFREHLVINKRKFVSIHSRICNQELDRKRGSAGHQQISSNYCLFVFFNFCNYYYVNLFAHVGILADKHFSSIRHRQFVAL